VILYIFSGRLNNCSRLHSPFVIIIARGGLTAFFFPYGNMPLCLQAIFCCEGGLLGLLFDTPLGKCLLRTLKYFLKQVLRSLLHPISVALLGGGPLPTSSVVHLGGGPLPTSSVDLLGEAAHSSVVLLGGGPMPTSSDVHLGGGPMPTSSVVLLGGGPLPTSSVVHLGGGPMPTSSVDLLGEAAHSSVVLLGGGLLPTSSDVHLGGGPLPTSSVVLLGGGPLPTSSVVLLCASRLYISAQSSFIYLAVIPAFVSATQDGAGSPPPLVEVNQAILAWSF
jgi:hypothetical protein